MRAAMAKGGAVLLLLSLLPATGGAVFEEDVGAEHSVSGDVSYNNDDAIPVTRRYCRDNVLNGDGSLVWCDGNGPDGKGETDFHHYILLWADVNGLCDCMDTYTGILDTFGLIEG